MDATALEVAGMKRETRRGGDMGGNTFHARAPATGNGRSVAK